MTELRSKQTVPGLATANFEVGRFQGIELVAFVSGTNVVVATADLHVLQQMNLGRAIHSVCWSSQGKLAAILSSGDAEVYMPVSSTRESNHAVADEHDVHFEHITTITSPTEQSATAATWQRRAEHLAVASGGFLTLFDVGQASRKESSLVASVTEIWKHPLVAPPALLAFSPDDRFLALCGANDRIVKVLHDQWDAEEQLMVPRFFYLPHPRGVKLLQWRNLPPSQQTWKADDGEQKGAFNVLLTSCRDDMHRMWCEISNASHELQFAVANVLDAPPGTVMSWLCAREEVHQKLERAKPSKPGQLQSSVSSSRVKFSAVSEDWIVGLESSGSIIIWGVQNLTWSRTQKMPSVFIWNKLAPLPEFDRNPQAIAAVGHTNLLEASHSLDMLSLFVKSRKGGLSSWRCFLRPTLTPVTRVRTGAF